MSPSSNYRIDWEKLKFFYYVAKIGIFTNAAGYLNITQSALSRTAHLLEETIGHRLFARMQEGVVLTE